MNLISNHGTAYLGDSTGYYIGWSVVGEYAPTSDIFPIGQNFDNSVVNTFYGRQGTTGAIAAKGTARGHISIFNVLNCGDDIAEHGCFGGYFNYMNNNYAFGNDTPGRAWGFDFVMNGPLGKRQSALGAFHCVLNNFYEGLPKDNLSGAYWAVTLPNFGPNISNKGLMNFPVHTGFGVIGFGTARTSLGFMTGVQVGGVGSNWGAPRSHIGIGVAVADCDAFGLLIRRKYSGVTDMVVQSGGTQYTGNPTGLFTVPTDGYQARVTGILTPTSVQTGTGGVVMGPKGSGYNSQTTVIFEPRFPGGAGTSAATGTATIVNGQVDSVNVTNGGSGYTTRPGVTFAGSGSGAFGIGVLVGTTVQKVVIDDPGAAYQSAPSDADFIGFGGSSGKARATIPGGSVQAVLVDFGGFGYVAGHEPAVTFSSGTAVASAVVGPDGTISGIFVKEGGSGYSPAPSVTIAAPSDITATASVTVTNNVITAVTLTEPGGFYTFTPTLTFQNTGGGSGASVRVDVFAGRVIKLTLLSGGSSYSGLTTASIDPPGNSSAGTLRTAKARATLGGIGIAVDRDGGPVVIGDIVPLDAKLTVLTNVAATKGTLIRGASSQTANLLEIQSSVPSGVHSRSCASIFRLP
jgi:hypothetical protein